MKKDRNKNEVRNEMAIRLCEIMLQNDAELFDAALACLEKEYALSLSPAGKNRLRHAAVTLVKTLYSVVAILEQDDQPTPCVYKA